MDAIAILGICLTVLGLIFAYIWKSNGKMQKEILGTVKEIAQGQKEIARMITEGFSNLTEGQKEIVQGQKEIARMITEGFSNLREGQKEISRMISEGLKYLADLIVQTSKK